MRSLTTLGLFAFSLGFVPLGCSSPDDAAQAPADAGPDLGLPRDPEDYREPPASCALNCDLQEGCEPDGYRCPAMSPWGALPHADACPKWDGTYPAPQAGKCAASLPTGAAAKKTGVDPSDPNTTILPTGYRAKPAGTTATLADTQGGFPTNVVAVDGTDLVVVVDGGIRDHAVRLVDTQELETAPDKAVKGLVRYGGGESTNFGAVVVKGAGPDLRRAYVAGGSAAAARLLAFDIDVVKRELRAVPSEDLPLPLSGAGRPMPSGVAARPDGKLVVGTQNNASGARLFVVDPATKKASAPIAIGNNEIFTVYLHPSDTAGRYAYVSSWDGDRVDVVDLEAAKVVKSIPVAKAPQAFVALDGRYLALISSDADVVTVVDTLIDGWAKVSETKIVEGSGYGWAPSGAAWDPATKRLYVSLAGLNAVAMFDVAVGAGAPALSLRGMVPTEWWPTAVTLRPTDGALVVVNGKGRGAGSNPIPFKPSEGNITNLMRGSVQLVPPSELGAFTGKTAVDALTDLTKLDGAPKVECGGAAYDFPIPATNTAGPSKVIKRVVFAIKENKTFDAVFGDLAGVDGDPKLIMAPGQMDAIFANERRIAQQFTVFDNYYTSAEQSLQGHVWTAYGRTTEFVERTWLAAWGRGLRLPVMGVAQGKPVEGSMFNWFQREKILFDNMGELAGAADDDKRTPKNCCLDPLYPGKFYAQDESDARKACYIAARARVTCDLKPFTYAVMPNDHTAGGSPGSPTVETYIAVGDEGTGQLLEALSKSPLWQETLVVVTMDDPQDGGDHVDSHRTPLLFAGPWVKRGYVSKGHYDTTSIHKLFAHIYGIPYPNEIVARASLPLDAFTSTPDYAPYDSVRRATKLACNPKTGKAATTAMMSHWDFSQPDQAPGLSAQIWELLHDGAPPPAGYGADDEDD
jgi:DNA-binding beta-propeller fold protein YncE